MQLNRSQRLPSSSVGSLGSFTASRPGNGMDVGQTGRLPSAGNAVQLHTCLWTSSHTRVVFVEISQPGWQHQCYSLD